MNNELFLHRDTHSHTHTNNKLLAVTLKMDRMTQSLCVPLHTVRERARFGWSRVCLPEKVIQACVQLTAVNFIKFSFTCTHAPLCVAKMDRKCVGLLLPRILSASSFISKCVCVSVHADNVCVTLLVD